MTATRTPLPSRRQNETREIVFDGKTYTVTVGFYYIGTPGEVFADGQREGSQMQAIIDDICIVTSIALQYGAPPEVLMHSLGRVPRWTEGKETEGWASLVGEIIATLEPRPALVAIGGAG